MLLSETEDKTGTCDIGKPMPDSMQSQILCMWRSFLTETREVSGVFGSGILDRINKPVDK